AIKGGSKLQRYTPEYLFEEAEDSTRCVKIAADVPSILEIVSAFLVYPLAHAAADKGFYLAQIAESEDDDPLTRIFMNRHQAATLKQPVVISPRTRSIIYGYLRVELDY
ncbi:hypothetical protein AX16_009115, partial [Volvariella volvacea WC 439]